MSIDRFSRACLPTLVLSLLVGACRQVPSSFGRVVSTEPRVPAGPVDSRGGGTVASHSGYLRDGWYGEDELSQGFLGIAVFDRIERVEQAGDFVDGSSDAISAQPLAGGGFQMRTGEQFGFEVMFSASGRQNEPLRLELAGGGSLPVEVDLLLIDIFGGPLVRTSLGARWSAFGAIGPLLQFAQWDEKGTAGDADSKGFGLGAYARIGVEYEGRGFDRVGLALRWSDVDVDLGDGRGDLSLEGLQLVFTMTQAF